MTIKNRTRLIDQVTETVLHAQFFLLKFRLKCTFVVNNCFMNKKEYIEKAKNLILNRVRFHAPVVYDDDIDKRVLFENGVDINKPIFKFDKKLNNKLIKAFELAKKEEDFNLLISTSSLDDISEKKLKSLGNVVIYSSSNSPISFLKMINKLNINYKSSSNYNLVYKDKFFKVNNQILNPNFKDFELNQKYFENGILINYFEFILNGNNYFIKLKNNTEKEKQIAIELNLPLKKGYYYFKKNKKTIIIENLITGEKLFFNYFSKYSNFSFSNVDGLENSLYCCIDVKLNLKIKPKAEEFVFFNMGDSKVDLKTKNQILEFRVLATKKIHEIFNIQIKTKNPKFDLFFNKTLPMKIWINWLNNEIDASLEEKYLSLKKMFVKGTESFSFVNFKEIGLKEIGIFNGEYYKKILIVQSEQQFLKVGQTVFYNINGITNYSLSRKEPIFLSFGE